MSDDTSDRPVVPEPSQAAAQLRSAMDRNERAAVRIERPALIEHRLVLAPDPGLERTPGERQEPAAIVCVEHSSGRYRH